MSILIAWIVQHETACALQQILEYQLQVVCEHLCAFVCVPTLCFENFVTLVTNKWMIGLNIIIHAFDGCVALGVITVVV